MINNFSLLGIGACGGNQVYAFKKFGLESFYINSAIEDLKSLGIDDINYYHIKNATGCHKDRMVSKQYLAQNFEEILSQIDRYLTGKYIFLFGSTGGGTSSGMIALMTELIENELNKTVIPVVTLPHFSESLQAKTNSYETLKELFESAKHTVFIVDNNKETNYVKSNETLANNIYSLISDVSNSTDGIYDYSEICAMLEETGYGIISTFNRKPTQIDITCSIKTAIKNNIFANIEERNSLYYCGLKISTTRKTISINQDELQLQSGYWRDIFIGYQTKSNLIFLSGLNYPSSTVDELYKSIQEDKIKIEKDMLNKSTIIFKDDFKISNQINKSDNKTVSARDKLMQMIGK